MTAERPPCGVPPAAPAPLRHPRLLPIPLLPAEPGLSGTVSRPPPRGRTGRGVRR